MGGEYVANNKFIYIESQSAYTRLPFAGPDLMHGCFKPITGIAAFPNDKSEFLSCS